MARPSSNRRYLLAVVWLGLLLAGCLAQVGLIQPATRHDPVAPLQLVKANPQGLGSWQARPDGRTDLTVRIGMSQAPLGNFSTKKVDLSAIAKVSAVLTLTDTNTTVAPTNEVGGYVSAPGGSFSLTFPPIAKGTKRVLVITGYTAANNAVPGAVIKALFDNTADTGSFEISYRTTPAATVFQGLDATAAAAVTSSGLNGALDAVTGYAGSPGVYPQCHPALVNTAALITLLNGNGGDVSPVTSSPATYRQSGTEVSHQFVLPPSPLVASDMPKLYSTDPATEVLDLSALAPSGSPGTYTTTNGSVTATIAATGQVDVTFHKVPSGTWTFGAALSGDGTTPNPKYYQLSPNVCGSTVSVAISGPNFAAFATGPYRAVEPTYATNQIRWRNTSAAGFQIQDLATTLPTVVSALTGTESSDNTIYVGPSVGGYTFAGSMTAPSGANTGTSPFKLVGMPSVAEAQRPRLTFATTDTVTLADPSHALRDLRLSGAQIQIMGGTLQRVTVDGQRIASGQGAAIAVVSNTFLLDQVRLFDVRHDAATPTAGTDALVGIRTQGTANGVIQNCLIDDNGAGGAFAIRYANTGGNGDLAGIAINSANVTVANTNVVAIGRISGTGLTATNATVAGITANATGGGISISNCSVSNIEAQQQAIGITLSGGTVANCTVENIATPPGVGPKVVGIRIGEGFFGDSEANQNTVRNLGEPTPTTPGLKVLGIELVGTSSSPATLKADGNTITQCGGEVFTGVGVNQDPGQASSFAVTNNSITACQVRDAAGAVFRGVDVAGTNVELPTLTVQHNDISSNIMFGNGCGVRAEASAGANSLTVSNNRFSNNQMSSTSGGNYSQAFTAIHLAGGGSSALTAMHNLITQNTLVDNAGLPSQMLDFTGVLTAGSSTDMIRNNVIAGNTFQPGNSDSSTVLLVSANMGGSVISNRIYDNALSAGFPTAGIYRAIHSNASSGSITVERNVVADDYLCRTSNRPAIQLGVTSPAVTKVRHNSLKVGDTYAPALSILNNGDVDIVNNALFAQNTAGTASGISRNSAAAGSPTVDFNWVVGWPTALTLVSDANVITAGPVFGVSNVSVNVGSHPMGTSGTTGNGGGVIGAAGSFTGVAALDEPPTY